MPIPSPHSGEDQSTFISRCMSDMSGEFKDNSQRAAVCHQAWRDRKQMSAQRFRTAAMSHSEIREAIYFQLDKRSRDTDGPYCYIVDVWEGYCVYMSHVGEGKSTMYKQMYAIGADESVSLEGDPVEIEPAYVKKGTMEVVASNLIFGQAANKLLADLKAQNPLVAGLDQTVNTHFIVMDLTTIGAPSKHQGNTKYLLEKDHIEAAAHTLISKPVHVTENYDGHVDAGKDPVAIGVFMGSWVVDNEDGTSTLRAVASLWKNDFPEKVEFIANNAAALGASYEVAYDPETAYFVKADKGVVHIRHYEFAGGSILFKDKAAHPETQILVATGVDPEELKLDGLSPDERAALPDDDFAFVLKGTKKIRRFPMHTTAARERLAAPAGYLDFAARLTPDQKAMAKQRIVARALVEGDAWAKPKATTQTKPKEGGASMKYKGIPEDLEGMVDLIVANAVQTATTELATAKKAADDAYAVATRSLETTNAELVTAKAQIVDLTNTASKAAADLEAKGKEHDATVIELKAFQDAKAELEEKAAVDAEWKKIAAQYGLREEQRAEREPILKKLVAKKEGLTVDEFTKLTGGGSKGGPTVQLMAGTGEPGRSTTPNPTELARTFPAAVAASAGAKLW